MKSIYGRKAKKSNAFKRPHVDPASKPTAPKRLTCERDRCVMGGSCTGPVFLSITSLFR